VKKQPCGCGTVFSVDPSGKETVLHRFAGDDGQFPSAGLTVARGRLFGVASQGGGTRCFQRKGCGAVFSIGTSGDEAVLYRFQGTTDGEHPSAPMVFSGRMLYGTTDDGGGTGCQAKRGCGTVFALTPP
jgi:hypothetical protein